MCFSLSNVQARFELKPNVAIGLRLLIRFVDALNSNNYVFIWMQRFLEWRRSRWSVDEVLVGLVPQQLQASTGDLIGRMPPVRLRGGTEVSD